MKQTKTTLKELTAMYRAVLRHGILCNAIALGLIATATPAMAERLILDEETTLTGQTFTGNSVTATSVDTETWTGTPEEPVIKTNAYLWTSPTDRTLQKDTEGKYIKGDIEQYTHTVTSSIAASDEAKGGAVYSTAALTISGGEFSDNAANGALTGQKVKDVYRKQEGWEDFVLESDNGGDKRTLNGAYGGAVYAGAGLTISNDAVFANNRSDKYGGAVYVVGNIDVDSASFTNNEGGAIYVDTGGTVAGSVKNATFTGNTGNSIYSKNANGLNISDSTFSGNSGAKVVENRSGNLDITNSTFTNNDGGILLLGAGTTGAVSSLRGITATGNTSSSRSNMYLYGKSGKTLIEDSTFSNNTTISNDGGVVMIANNSDGPAVIRNSKFIENSTQGNSSATGGAVAFGNSVSYTGTGNEYTGNHAGTNGGALANTASANLITEIGATFSGNSADGDGGAIWFNTGNTYPLVASIIDSSFTNNTANGQGGAIHNAHNKGETKKTTLNLIAKDSDVMFSGNTAGGEANDIYNTSTLNLVAAEGRMISLGGGIDGDAGIININKDISYDYYEENDGTFTRKNASVTSPNGTVEIFGALKNQTVDLGAGELHLNNTDLTGSTVTVASGATINTIDNLVNDYTGAITLADGANIKGDIDFMNGTADKYLSTGVTSVNYKVGNLIGSVGNGTKNIQVASDGTTVNDAGFAWATSTEGLSLVSSGNADGMVAVTGLSGGIAEATDVSANVNEIDYTLTAAETLTTAKTMYHNFALTGGGTNDTDNGLNLAANLSTDENASVKISKLKLSGSGTLNNAGLMHINDSLIDVDVNNSGVLISDPTTYSGTVTNSNFASFDNDTFTATATLANTGTVSLYNGVTFDAGASITGAGVTNLVSGYTHFHDTANANTINVVSGANFDGAIVGGKINTQNGMIDNFAGSIQNMDVAMDVNTASGTADTFASITGSTIKSLSVSGGYGTADSVDVTIGSGLTLDSATEINGGYYTKVEQSGTTLTFSDKLVNASGMQANAAKADYSASGTYADGTIGKAIQGKQDTLTAGDAITISSDSNISVADSGITTGKLADGAVTTDKIADGTITFADLNGGAVATSTTVNLASPSDEKLVTEKAVVAGITNLVAEKETWVNNTLGITAANPNAVNDEYVGTNYLTSATTLTGADIALDSAIKANANDIAKIVDGTTVVAKAYADEDGNNIKTTYATKAEVTAGVTAVYDHAHDWAESLLGLDVDENVANQLQNGLAALGGTNNIEATTIAGALHELDTEKQNIITDTATIAADGTGFSVVAGSIDTAQLKDGGVTADKLADGAVTSGKVADGAITTAKIADGTITFADLNAGMVVKSGTDVNIATPSEEKLVTERLLSKVSHRWSSRSRRGLMLHWVSHLQMRMRLTTNTRVQLT